METVMSNQAVAVLSLGSVYWIFLCRLGVPVFLCHCVTIFTSSRSGEGRILIKL